MSGLGRIGHHDQGDMAQDDVELHLAAYVKSRNVRGMDIDDNDVGHLIVNSLDQGRDLPDHYDLVLMRHAVLREYSGKQRIGGADQSLARLGHFAVCKTKRPVAESAY